MMSSSDGHVEIVGSVLADAALANPNALVLYSNTPFQF
jgi:hypothetical protein